MRRPSFFCSRRRATRSFGQPQRGVDQQLAAGRSRACGGCRRCARSRARVRRRASRGRRTSASGLASSTRSPARGWSRPMATRASWSSTRATPAAARRAGGARSGRSRSVARRTRAPAGGRRRRRRGCANVSSTSPNGLSRTSSSPSRRRTRLGQATVRTGSRPYSRHHDDLGVGIDRRIQDEACGRVHLAHTLGGRRRVAVRGAAGRSPGAAGSTS